MKTHRFGFTIVELLVVVGIVGLLVAILIPAIQYARESSRCSHCLANLRQLGVALHSYHDSFQGLPPSVIWWPAGEPLGGGGFPIGVIDAITAGAPPSEDRMRANWVVMLLPFLEERALAAQFDWHFSVGSAANESARSNELTVMKCPTDPFSDAANHFQRSFVAADTGYARGNYGLNLGTNRGCLKGEPACQDGYSFEGSGMENRRIWGSGVGGVNHSTRFREFPNGLSKTVAVEEIRAGIDPIDRRGVWALGFVGCSVTASHGHHRNSHRGPNKGLDFIQGCPKLQAKSGDRLLAENMPCSYRRIPIEISEKATARSMHSGGVNLLMADGSAHFVAGSVDATVWHYMHRRDAPATFEMPF